ncbi:MULTISPECIES: hypothetical protein [Xanthomonas]|uniref:LPXTG cell wall anchor domain-containing protein n=2 Tax=Xanthomonas TaxID=338 RepID=A0ABZ0JRC5_9XANT|nr:MULTISPECIES: hypothetical protein [Xanthomonas]MCC4590788.1 hypothetical protein [Xanthomonas campestris pv. cannae]MBB5875423.1 cytochrome c-type biogenesis protein CcmH/NrfF [Xanthomonas sp. 3498]MBB5942821.1 cytochrome c-type biogenesis protein CcmH/NrfF [Xanthomonas sp. 3307]MBB6367425.1 cytochrome c-type biogenesis protein CcmH/NrfF [Xanthomonas sp. F10]MBO9829395.1 hypothetical protein [Xanthomonas sp. A2111]
MDTTLMPWVAGLFVLLIAAMLYLVTRAKKNRNRPAQDHAATKSDVDSASKR